MRLTVGDFDNTADTFPSVIRQTAPTSFGQRLQALHPAQSGPRRADKLQLEFIANRQSDLAALQLWHLEPCEPALIQTHVPPDGDIIFGLRFFHPLVVVRLDLDERAEDVLVLVRIFVSAVRDAKTKSPTLAR